MNLLYLPALGLVLLFVLLPLVTSVKTSFYNWNGYSPVKKFVGIKNYLDLLKDENFKMAFLNTILYGFGSTILQNVLGLALALFLNTKFAGHKVVRTIVYLPVMISGLIMGYIMYFVVQNTGAINEILGWFGLQGRDWMASGAVGRVFITLINSWQYCGICMVIYMAGLQNISRMYYEAAAIDGATSIQKFFKITVPMLKPILAMCILMDIIGSVKVFDLVFAMTGGGPNGLTNLPTTLMYNEAFKYNHYGVGSAIGIIIMVICIVGTVGSNLITNRKKAE